MNFHVGLFRLICSNGLVVADATFGKLNLRHMGYSFDNVRGMIGDITEKLPVVFNTIRTFEKTELTEQARREFAMKAFAIRYPEYIKENNLVDMALISSSVDVNALLTPYRSEDAPNNLWTVFNRVQEKLVNGQFKHLGDDNKLRQARPIKNITLNLDINEDYGNSLTHTHNENLYIAIGPCRFLQGLCAVRRGCAGRVRESGDGPDDRGNCFGYDEDHPPYEETDYRCHFCDAPLDEQDN